jgi:hypothetical protein
MTSNERREQELWSLSPGSSLHPAAVHDHGGSTWTYLKSEAHQDHAGEDPEEAGKLY